MDKKESTFLTDVVKTANIKKKEVVKSKTGNIQFIDPFYLFLALISISFHISS